MKIGKAAGMTDLQQQLSGAAYPLEVTVTSNISAPLVVGGVLLHPNSSINLTFGDSDAVLRAVSDMQQLSELKGADHGFELVLPASPSTPPPVTEKPSKKDKEVTPNG